MTPREYIKYLSVTSVTLLSYFDQSLEYIYVFILIATRLKFFLVIKISITIWIIPLIVVQRYLFVLLQYQNFLLGILS